MITLNDRRRGDYLVKKIPHIKAWSDGDVCIANACAFVRDSKCPNCHPVRCYDEPLARLLEGEHKAIAGFRRTGSLDRFYKEINRLEMTWAKNQKKRKRGLVMQNEDLIQKLYRLLQEVLQVELPPDGHTIGHILSSKKPSLAREIMSVLANPPTPVHLAEAPLRKGNCKPGRHNFVNGVCTYEGCTVKEGEEPGLEVYTVARRIPGTSILQIDIISEDEMGSKKKGKNDPDKRS